MTTTTQATGWAGLVGLGQADELLEGLVAGAVAGDLDAVAVAALGLLDLGAALEDLGGETELGYAVADCLTALEYLDRDGLELGAEAVAAAAVRLGVA